MHTHSMHFYPEIQHFDLPYSHFHLSVVHFSLSSALMSLSEVKLAGCLVLCFRALICEQMRSFALFCCHTEDESIHLLVFVSFLKMLPLLPAQAGDGAVLQELGWLTASNHRFSSKAYD